MLLSLQLVRLGLCLLLSPPAPVQPCFSTDSEAQFVAINSILRSARFSFFSAYIYSLPANLLDETTIKAVIDSVMHGDQGHVTRHWMLLDGQDTCGHNAQWNACAVREISKFQIP